VLAEHRRESLARQTAALYPSFRNFLNFRDREQELHLGRRRSFATSRRQKRPAAPPSGVRELPRIASAPLGPQAASKRVLSESPRRARRSPRRPRRNSALEDLVSTSPARAPRGNSWSADGASGARRSRRGLLFFLSSWIDPLFRDRADPPRAGRETREARRRQPSSSARIASGER